ncbi:PREDICTED: uncharacterized protein LOC105313751 [Amphimedon queenslandica]|uniref:LRAT domain-containing protein n=1 Tax=Amphimedon queenslandica TaxID=400682 RepID=A0A1X7UA82_AMPQE|nr:PREDICTED: uncharacterized protein LOC105313751 [Amphimedon queenslandica]|eukprot:XP_011405725.1 PREDICTED: uncharacterized protein LOC105313751 [Amphimedon queenslandica]
MAMADDSSSRAGFISHSVDKNDLRPGDHIYCHRIGYTHHGIYIDEPGCEVIHFSGDDKGSLEKKWNQQSGELSKRVARLSSEKDQLPEDSARAKEIKQELDEIYEDDRIVCIKSTTLANFLNGATLRLVSYDCSFIKKIFVIVRSSCHTKKAMPPSETIKLAKHFLYHPQEWGNYELTSNNCENFACFCKTGDMNIATQLQYHSNAFSETVSEFLFQSCQTAEDALRNYRQIKANKN